MNIRSLLSTYFPDRNLSTIEVFDDKDIFETYHFVINNLLRLHSINLNVLQILGYCLFELMDNVLIHSDKSHGCLIYDYDKDSHTLSLLIADDGKGIAASLRQNEAYASLSDSEALRICLDDGVTDGEGRGFGLFSFRRMIEMCGTEAIIRSGSVALTFIGHGFELNEAQEWKGTLLYFKIRTDLIFEPDYILGKRTDVEKQFNDMFFIDDIDLW